MKFQNLEEKNKLIIDTDDIARILSISKNAAYVAASRYVKKELLIRLKRNYYITSNKLKTINEKELFTLANFLQVPSYISFTSALSYYNLTTQQTQYFIESAGNKRTKFIEIKHLTLSYTKLKKEFYTGFEKNNNFFIALPEKALADIVYLSSMNRYQFDYSSIDLDKFNKKDVLKFLNLANSKALKYWEKLCSTLKI